ncbi:MAG TPA: prephenate dehydratase domain-containing protein, partial [Chloroflexota bacterium]|nr:prephenate dehydratase domain-containing protein [Chloroflexota bacterium]
TFDRLVDTNLKVCAELELPISHNLLSSGTLEQIATVYSHPQPFAQCRRWLADNLPRAALVETASTALAAQKARTPETAAIATESASRAYDLPILVAHIEDVASNATRFLVIGPEMSRPTGNDQTAVMFTVRDHAGALHGALRAFAESGINLSRIESRPSRRKRWEYVFFVDLDGHAEEAPVARALERLEGSASTVKVLGTWPRPAT